MNALEGKGAHLVTPNDYLSRVGGGWMGPVYARLGMTTGVIAHDFSGIYDAAYIESPSHGDDRLDHWRPVTRREAYAADITYGTNNEFGFDYLRDNMAGNLDQMVQPRRPAGVGAPIEASGRMHHYAIVDEVDSILIDEARTPLIISAPDQESGELYQVFSRITPKMKEGLEISRGDMHKVETEWIWYGHVSNLNATIEVLDFRAFIRRAEQRNQAFFNKLGLR